jgi:HlyD family secretion protein
MRNKFVIISAVAMTSLAVGGAVGFARHQTPEMTVVAARDDIPGQIYGLGTIEPRVLSRLGFAVTGTLAAVLVDHGDRVPSGTVLARLDTQQQDARLEQAQAETGRALANVEQARAQLERSHALLALRQSTDRRKQLLVRSGFVAVETAEEAHTDLQVAVADVAVAESNLQVSASTLTSAGAATKVEQALRDQHVIVAPYAALVVERLAEPGTVMVPGQVVLTLADPESIWAELYVDEAAAGGLAVGMPVEMKLRSRPGETFGGRIARIGIEADRVGSDRRIYTAFDHIPDQFTLGEQVEGLITVTRPNLVTIPEEAIVRQAGRVGVWTVKDSRTHWERIALGRRFADGRREVMDGLVVGTMVVQSSATDRLSEGTQILRAETPR